MLCSRQRIYLAAGLWCGLVAMLCAVAPAAPKPERSAIAPILQNAAARALGKRAGAVAVADVASGHLLAVRNLPLASRRVVHPGSVLKPFTLIALLESKTIAPDTALICRRHLRLAGHQLDCVHVRVPEPLDPVAALAYSCNSFFAEAASRLGSAELQRELLRAGLGSPTGWADDDDEAVGSVAPPTAIRVVPKGRARIRVCAGCSWTDLTSILDLRGEGNRVRGGRGSGIREIAGRYEIETDTRAAALDFPVTIRAISGRLRITGAMPLEQYVAAAVAGEAATMRSAESLKAMAVAARTWAVRFRGRHGSFDFCDSTHCQRLRPADISGRIRAAVAETEGELLWYEGRPAAAYYHRSCGGITEEGSGLDASLRAPYLPSHVDPYCLTRDRGQWQSEIGKAELQHALAAAGISMERVTGVSILSRTSSGRAASAAAALAPRLVDNCQTGRGYTEAGSLSHGAPPDMKSRVFSPANTHRLEDPERLQWLPPAEVLDRLHVAPGMVIADVGAGTGYFSLPLARAVAPGGKLYAIDFQAEMLALLARKLELGNFGNIVLVEGSASETTLADGSCDLVLLANIWHELDNAPEVLKEIQRVVRPGGCLAILDWRPDVTGSPEPPLELRRSAEQVSDLVTAHGWKVLTSNNVGSYSYLLVFRIAAAEL